jgi:hypothetical protein
MFYCGYMPVHASSESRYRGKSEVWSMFPADCIRPEEFWVWGYTNDRRFLRKSSIKCTCHHWLNNCAESLCTDFSYLNAVCSKLVFPCYRDVILFGHGPSSSWLPVRPSALAARFFASKQNVASNNFGENIILLRFFDNVGYRLVFELFHRWKVGLYLSYHRHTHACTLTYIILSLNYATYSFVYIIIEAFQKFVTWKWFYQKVIKSATIR